MDLPAPVSPLRTFRPGPNGAVTDSITAKFRMRSSRSIGMDARSVGRTAQAVSGAIRRYRSPHFSFVRSTEKNPFCGKRRSRMRAPPFTTSTVSCTLRCTPSWPSTVAITSW